MAGENGGPPQDLPPGGPSGGPSEPDDVMAVIRQMIDSRLEQGLATVRDQMTAIEQRLAQQLTEGIARIEAKFAAPASQPTAQPAGPAVELPALPEIDKGALAGAWFKDNITDPGKLATTVGEIAKAIAQVRGAFQPMDDFATARAIALRNPAAIVLVAPDPTQGALPTLLSNVIQQGVRIGATARGVANLPGTGGGTTPLAPSAPGVSPAGPPGPSPVPTPPPGTPKGTASLGQALAGLSDDARNTLIAYLVEIGVRRQGA